MFTTPTQENDKHNVCYETPYQVLLFIVEVTPKPMSKIQK